MYQFHFFCCTPSWFSLGIFISNVELDAFHSTDIVLRKINRVLSSAGWREIAQIETTFNELRTESGSMFMAGARFIEFLLQLNARISFERDLSEVKPKTIYSLDCGHTIHACFSNSKLSFVSNSRGMWRSSRITAKLLSQSKVKHMFFQSPLRCWISPFLHEWNPPKKISFFYKFAQQWEKSVNTQKLPAPKAKAG